MRLERSYSHCHGIRTSPRLRHPQPTRLCSSERHVSGLLFFREPCTQTLLQPDVSRPFPLCCLSLSKHHNKGHPRTFGPTKRVYLETMAVFPPSNLSQDPAPADALLRWLLVGSKEARRKRRSVGAHPHRSAVVYLKQAGRRHYRRPRSTCTFTRTHIHIPIDVQPFTAQPVILAGLVCVARLLPPPHFTATV